LQHFIAQGRTPAITGIASQDIKQFMFQASGGRDIDAVNNVEAKAKKIYERSFAKKRYKTLRMLLMYNLAKRAGKKQGEKSVGLEVSACKCNENFGR
jgi:diacylglycerol kinase family enzyme